MKNRHKKDGLPEPLPVDSVQEEAAPAGEVPATPPAATETPPSPEAAAAEKKAAEERYLRLLADFENFRKRTLREKTELFRQANEDLIRELLPVLDHLDLALEAPHSKHSNNAVIQGVRMVADQLHALILKFGVTPVETEGQVFDPTRHEAITHLPSETVPENAIVQQVRKGYALGPKLLRAAQVVVSSGPAKPVAAPDAVPSAPEPEKEEE